VVKKTADESVVTWIGGEFVQVRISIDGGTDRSRRVFWSFVYPNKIGESHPIMVLVATG
jgi:hypothetical protein